MNADGNVSFIASHVVKFTVTASMGEDCREKAHSITGSGGGVLEVYSSDLPR